MSLFKACGQKEEFGKSKGHAGSCQLNMALSVWGRTASTARMI